VIGGKGDLFASLMMKEKGSRNLLSSIDGTLSLRGDNLVTYTIDLDNVLSSYERARSSTSWTSALSSSPDRSVPLRSGGTVMGTLQPDPGGQGVITHFISHWKIKGGVADATDCAFATRHNRVALKASSILSANDMKM